MQDRFKFRAWNLEKGIMHYDVEDTYDGISNNAIQHSNFSAVLEDNEYIVMQCTGFKDRNGKLIYEGDVVGFGSENEDIGIIEWDNDECRFIVDEKFNNSISDFSNWYGNELEIIGNIYQNPELLKEI